MLFTSKRKVLTDISSISHERNCMLVPRCHRLMSYSIQLLLSISRDYHSEHREQEKKIRKIRFWNINQWRIYKLKFSMTTSLLNHFGQENLVQIEQKTLVIYKNMRQRQMNFFFYRNLLCAH